MGRPSKLKDTDATTGDFLKSVLRGLRKDQRELPCKYLYDERGSALFERICQVEEYYLTRAETALMLRYSQDIATQLGSNIALIEYGSGSSTKTRILLDHLESPEAYIPVDISRDFLFQSASDLAIAYPDLRILPICADFTRSFTLPGISEGARRVVYFPGSTIGNLSSEEMRLLLAGIVRLCGSDGGLVLGTDLIKDIHLLESAYDDKMGLTKDFNCNLLVRINRELGSDFILSEWQHRARWNPKDSRMEMHLVSTIDQQVVLAGETFSFRKDETIHTESSYKYDLKELELTMNASGLYKSGSWIDDHNLFSVQFWVVKS